MLSHCLSWSFSLCFQSFHPSIEVLEALFSNTTIKFHGQFMFTSSVYLKNICVVSHTKLASQFHINITGWYYIA